MAKKKKTKRLAKKRTKKLTLKNTLSYISLIITILNGLILLLEKLFKNS